MVREKKAKTATLLIVIIILIGSFISVPDWSIIGVTKDCALLSRVGYSFFHVTPIHAAINAWCLICIVFRYDISLVRLLVAYMVAVAVPQFVLSAVPTVGMSCVCYVLLGSLSFEVKRKLYYQLCIAPYIVVGFMFPSVNAAIHVYGYISGLMVGVLNAPLSCLKK